MLFKFYDTQDSTILDAVESALDKWLAAEPDSMTRNLTMALFYLEYNHDPERAVALLTRFYNIHPEPLVFLVLCYWHDSFLGGFDAEEYWQLERISGLENDLEAFRLFVMASFYAGKASRQNEHTLLMRAAELKPDYVNAYSNLALSFAEAGDREQAEYYLQLTKSAVSRISDELTPDMLLDIDFYFQESVYGSICTQLKLDELSWSVLQYFNKKS